MNFDLIVQVLFLCFFSLVLAALETQIEGGFGWAAKLPTWRPRPGAWYARLYRKVMWGKELTLYHVLIFSLVLLFFHYPYFVSQNWDWSSELTTVSLFFLVVVVWDFLWFVVNPRYDFNDFWAEKVWWHKKWFLHLPVDYWFAFLASALFYTKFSISGVLLKEWLVILFLFLFFTLITGLLADVTNIVRIKGKDK